MNILGTMFVYQATDFIDNAEYIGAILAIYRDSAVQVIATTMTTATTTYDNKNNE